MMDDNFQASKPTAVEISYRGYVIRFSENQERWACPALDIDAEKMATIKTKIDKIVAASRKLDEEKQAIYIDYHGKGQPVRVVAYAQPRRGGSEPTQAWCIMKGRERYYDPSRGGYAFRDVDERKKLELDKLYADTPETHAILREVERMDAEIAQIQTKRKAEREKLTLAQRAFEIDPVDPVQENANA